jgi:hypothetical protein
MVLQRMGFYREKLVCSAPSNTVPGGSCRLVKTLRERLGGVSEERLNWVRGVDERGEDVGSNKDRATFTENLY